MYMDVQQLKMVQMVSQSQFFRGFYLLYLMRLPEYVVAVQLVDELLH